MRFIQVLQLVFITLKLAEIGVVKDWSWWLVLSPFLTSIIIGAIYHKYINKK